MTQPRNADPRLPSILGRIFGAEPKEWTERWEADLRLIHEMILHLKKEGISKDTMLALIDKILDACKIYAAVGKALIDGKDTGDYYRIIGEGLEMLRPLKEELYNLTLVAKDESGKGKDEAESERQSRRSKKHRHRSERGDRGRHSKETSSSPITARKQGSSEIEGRRGERHSRSGSSRAESSRAGSSRTESSRAESSSERSTREKSRHHGKEKTRTEDRGSEYGEYGRSSGYGGYSFKQKDKPAVQQSPQSSSTNTRYEKSQSVQNIGTKDQSQDKGKNRQETRKQSLDEGRQATSDRYGDLVKSQRAGRERLQGSRKELDVTSAEDNSKDLNERMKAFQIDRNRVSEGQSAFPSRTTSAGTDDRDYRDVFGLGAFRSSDSQSESNETDFGEMALNAALGQPTTKSVLEESEFPRDFEARRDKVRKALAKDKTKK